MFSDGSKCYYRLESIRSKQSASTLMGPRAIDHLTPRVKEANAIRKRKRR